MLRSDWLLLFILAVPGRALLNPFDRILLSAVKRPQFEQRVKERFGGAPIRYVDDASTPQATSFEIWHWADQCSAGKGETVLCLPPTCTVREVSFIPCKSCITLIDPSEGALGTGFRLTARAFPGRAIRGDDSQRVCGEQCWRGDVDFISGKGVAIVCARGLAHGATTAAPFRGSRRG